MSTDYDVVCRSCGIFIHLGQRFASGWSFGFGSDDVEGRKAAGEFIVEHEEHGDLAVIESDRVPPCYVDVEFDVKK